MSEEKKVITILERPAGLRFIGVTQMLFGILGFLASIGVLFATISGVLLLQPMGYVYSLALFLGVALPCFIIGYYVDDMRRDAVIAQIIYSIIAIGLAGFLIYARGISYEWTFPVFELTLQIAIGNVAAFIILVQAIFVIYLLVGWKKVVPPKDVKVIRDKKQAQLVEEGFLLTPLSDYLLAPDGEQELSEDQEKLILSVRKIMTEEGMAILCSNCGGANPLSNAKQDNTLDCEYCGITMGVSSVFVPCENHPEFLAATTCAVCGGHFCRQCLTVQEPPIDERWESSTIFLCRTCFEGRYRPAVTTTSLVIPIEGLFATAGGRFSRVGGIYRSFLGAYGSGLKHIWRLPLQLLASMGKSGGGSGGSNDCGSAILVIIILIIAIPVLAGILMLLGAIVIIPILFYAGLVGVTIEAVKIISKTDFVSLDKARITHVVKKAKPKVQESKLRPAARPWEDDLRVRDLREIERRKREDRRRRERAESFWGRGI